MNKEKEIDEMAKTNMVGCTQLCSECKRQPTCDMYYTAEVLVEAGYRKADEVRKETAKEILLYLKATITDGLLKNHEILNALMKEYGVGVEE